MHTAFSRPIVHRNLKASSVFLDQNYVAKLSDFSITVSIPEGESHVKDRVEGTIGLIAPESLRTGCFNEKNDVYGFGVLLPVMLTGQRAFDSSRPEKGEEFLLVDHVKKNIQKNRFREMVDPSITAKEPWPRKEQQLEAFAGLAFKCTYHSAEDRPTMIEVAKELRYMYQIS
ncbi:hypothetical protein Tsubulata_037076 [Turnera subulata]|uniref:Protein kinase domain-containing protein n=1 Tax=Turnera subulata TaxID=218843 RepID=A0A9Q0FWB0_9ROSI|nr:hypothetical protein Tsubulata_037076 [Turnera subulata]